MNQMVVITVPRLYADAMRTIILCGLCVMLMVIGVWGGQTAEIGSRFAEVYGAFAPLGALHRAYADFLFHGTAVVIPDDLSYACQQTGYLLGLLHIDLFAQTNSHVAETITRLVRVRSDLAAFCAAHSETLIELTLTDPPLLDLLKQASEWGLFSSIHRLQQGLQFTFEAYFDDLEDDRSTWEFAVAFALRTLLDQEKIGQIKRNLQDILYGSEQALLPPAFVCQEIAVSIMRLVEFIDIPLEESMVEEIRFLAQLIYHYVVSEPVSG